MYFYTGFSTENRTKVIFASLLIKQFVIEEQKKSSSEIFNIQN